MTYIEETRQTKRETKAMKIMLKKLETPNKLNEIPESEWRKLPTLTTVKRLLAFNNAVYLEENGDDDFAWPLSNFEIFILDEETEWQPGDKLLAVNDSIMLHYRKGDVCTFSASYETDSFEPTISTSSCWMRKNFRKIRSILQDGYIPIRFLSDSKAAEKMEFEDAKKTTSPKQQMDFTQLQAIHDMAMQFKPEGDSTDEPYQKWETMYNKFVGEQLHPVYIDVVGNAEQEKELLKRLTTMLCERYDIQEADCFEWDGTVLLQDSDIVLSLNEQEDLTVLRDCKIL